jgi:regulator of protease activity HflC (stomatin/prohibitin superfamily)
MKLPHVIGLIVAGVLAGGVVWIMASNREIVPAGHCAVVETLGKQELSVRLEGSSIWPPFASRVAVLPSRWTAATIATDCYTEELFKVTVGVRVSYRIPAKSVVSLYQAYGSDPFGTFLIPRIQAAVKKEVHTHKADALVGLPSRKAIEAVIAAAAGTLMEKPAETLELRIDDIVLPAAFIHAVAMARAVDPQEKELEKKHQLQQLENERLLAQAKFEAELKRVRLPALAADAVPPRALEK